MRLFLKRRDMSIDAVAEWDIENNTFVVLKGSIVSSTIAVHTKFRSARSVEKARSNGVVVGQELMKDMTFKSASSAANFVTGASTNGMVAWKNSEGKTVKDIIAVR